MAVRRDEGRQLHRLVGAVELLRLRAQARVPRVPRRRHDDEAARRGSRLRARDWEYEERALDRYGTPMSMMLLPYLTDGCIGSMEGLYFESSGTTPYHFLNAAELSPTPVQPGPRRPERPISYSTFDLDAGVRTCRCSGVRYYMAFSTRRPRRPTRIPISPRSRRRRRGRSTRSRDAPLVEALASSPPSSRACPTRTPSGRTCRDRLVPRPARNDVPLASDGPDEWQRDHRGRRCPSGVRVPEPVGHQHRRGRPVDQLRRERGRPSRSW